MASDTTRRLNFRGVSGADRPYGCDQIAVRPTGPFLITADRSLQFRSGTCGGPGGEGGREASHDRGGKGRQDNSREGGEKKEKE